MDAADKQNANGSSQDMDTSTPVLGKRNRTIGATMDTDAAAGGHSEKRPRSEAPEIAVAIDSEVVREHAQWWNPELNPHVEAHNSTVMEGVDGAASA